MRFSYNKHWKLMIDRAIHKKTLRVMSGIGATSVVKLGYGCNINKENLLRICTTLMRYASNIMETVLYGTKREKAFNNILLFGGLQSGN